MTRTDGALLLCFLPPSLRRVCYDSVPRAEPLLPEQTPRSTRPANSTHRIVSWHESRFIKAAAYARTCLRRIKGMPHVAALYRYPVKGFTPEASDTLTVRDDGRIAGDRVLGIRFADSAAADEAWSKKTEMVALMNTPGLARLHLRFEEAARRLRLSCAGTVFMDVVLTEEGRQRLATAVAEYVLTLDENPLAGHPKRLPLRVIGDGLTPRYHDAEAGQVTLHGRGSLNALTAALAHADGSEQRFRCNIALEGLGACEELR